MEKLLDAKTYRRVAQLLEKELTTLYDDQDELTKLFLPVTGDSYHFPRPTQEASILEDQLALLQERLIEGIAILQTLATIAMVKEENKEKLPVYSLLEEQLKAQVKPYVDFFNEPRRQQSGKNKEEK